MVVSSSPKEALEEEVKEQSKKKTNRRFQMKKALREVYVWAKTERMCKLHTNYSKNDGFLLKSFFVLHFLTDF